MAGMSRTWSGGRSRRTIATAPLDSMATPLALIFLVLGFTPWLLVLTLAVTLYLTVIELRTMDVHYTRWVWWLLLVFMTHFVGYLFLRAYVLYRRRQFA